MAKGPERGGGDGISEWRFYFYCVKDDDGDGDDWNGSCVRSVR